MQQNTLQMLNHCKVSRGWHCCNWQWQWRVSYWGSVACKSPSCYHCTLKYREPLQGEGQRAASHSVGKQGKRGHAEIFTYSQTDFLALSSPGALMSDPLLPVQEGERHVMTMGPKQDKEEKFKFRPLLPPSPLSGHWGCLVFVNSFSLTPWAASLSSIVSFQ